MTLGAAIESRLEQVSEQGREPISQRGVEGSAPAELLVRKMLSTDPRERTGAVVLHLAAVEQSGIRERRLESLHLEWLVAEEALVARAQDRHASASPAVDEEDREHDHVGQSQAHAAVLGAGSEVLRGVIRDPLKAVDLRRRLVNEQTDWLEGSGA